MANLEKFKKNPVAEWLEGEDNDLPSQSRNPHILGDYIKIRKSALGGRARQIPPKEAPKIDLALAREAAPLKVEERHSQAASPEHLRKQERLTQLRAPFARSAGGPARGAR
jgi:hypothetical protein